MLCRETRERLLGINGVYRIERRREHDDALRHAVADARDVLDMHIHIARHEQALAARRAGKVADRLADVLGIHLTQRNNVEDRGARDRADGRGGDAVGPNAERLIELSTNRIGTKIAANDDRDEVVTPLDGRKRG